MQEIGLKAVPHFVPHTRRKNPLIHSLLCNTLTIYPLEKTSNDQGLKQLLATLGKDRSFLRFPIRNQ